MNILDELKIYIGAYYGISELNEYVLKEYVLKDIEKLIDKYIKEHHISKIEYNNIKDEYVSSSSFKVKLQDSLIILNRHHMSLDLIVMIKRILNNNDNIID